MGFVGLTLGIVLSETNSFNVTDFDINTKIINDLNNKIPPFFEKGIKESLSHLIDNERIKFSDKINDSYDIHIITVGTPIKYPSIPNSPSHKAAQGRTLFLFLM